jgi:NAD(P)H dehydrogenase (quinone)
VSEPGHEGKTYDITTPQAVSLSELATIASDVTGDEYRYESEDDAWWEARWRARGREEWSIEAGHTSYEALRRGEFDVVTDDYRTITGREPKTIAQIIECLANEMPLRTI